MKKLKIPWFRRCGRCGKLLIRFKDRKAGSINLKYKKGRVKEVPICAKCGVNIIRAQIETMENLTGRRSGSFNVFRRLY